MKLRIAAIVLTILLIILGLHYVLYQVFVTFFSITNRAALLTAQVAFAVLSVSFVAMSLVAYRMDSLTVRTLYTASAVWLGTAHWLLVASVVASIVYLTAGQLAPSANILPACRAVLLAALAVSAWGVWHSFHPKVKRVSVHLKNLPKQWRGRRAVLVADMHFGSVRGRGTARRLVSQISALEPDIVFISGDFYDGPPLDTASVSEPFADLNPKFGTFFAAGNHEEYGDKRAFEAALGSAGVRVLADEAVGVDGLNVAGVDYADAYTASDEARILQSLKLKGDECNVLIKHVPNNIEIAERAGVSLQLSGHTHVGQMWPLGYIAQGMFGKFYYGLSAFKNMQVYTTSGYGTWGPPQRIGTHAEIVVITFT